MGREEKALVLNPLEATVVEKNDAAAQMRAAQAFQYAQSGCIEDTRRNGRAKLPYAQDWRGNMGME